jgi:hypothetical protein
MKNRERWFHGYYVVRCNRLNKEYGDWSESNIRIEYTNQVGDQQRAWERAMALYQKNIAGGHHSMVQRYTSESQIIVDSNDTED